MTRSKFRRLAVIGVGLMGGSLALAWRQSDAVGEVIGYDSSAAVLAEASAAGIIDRAAGSLAAALAGADLVLLAVPVGALLPLAGQVAAHVEPGAVVTDTGSTKRQVVAAFEAALQGKARYVGGHPMGGSERSGPGAARADLIAGAVYVLTPVAATDPAALSAMRHLARAAGAYPLEAAPAWHDRAVAAVSHLPQLTAWALVQASLAEEAAAADGDQDTGLTGENTPSAAQPDQGILAARGFRDTTRLAGSDPVLWRDVCLTNGDEIIGRLDRLAEEISALRRMIELGDADTLTAYFSGARHLRRRLDQSQSPAGPRFQCFQGG